MTTCACACGPLVLVTGATGNNGKKVAELLLASGRVKVRVGVRDEAKAADLKAKGAEVVKFDWADPATVNAAFQGVQRAFILTAISFTWVGQVEIAVNAAKAAKVGFLCLFAASGANPNAPFWIAKEHGMAEELVANSGIAYATLRPSFFLENFIAFSAGTIKGQGAFYGCAGAGKTAFVSTDDISAVAANVLLDPAAYAFKRLEITGGQALSGEECAAVLTKVIGKPVKYVDLPEDAYKGAMMGNGIPEKLAQGLVELEIVKKNNWAATVTDVVKTVCKREPKTLEEVITANKAAFL